MVQESDKLIIGVIGGSFADKKARALAREVGKQIAKRGWLLVCGGLSGVMEEVCHGAKEEAGTTIGILPGKDKNDANKYVDIPIVTAMSHARNAIITRTADLVIALPGKSGTLSEIGLSLAVGKTVIGLCAWKNIQGVIYTETVNEAMERADKIIGY